MSEILVLFDIDGSTAVVSPDKVDRKPVKASTFYVNAEGKKLLAEVLEISNSKDEIDNYEENWTMSYRAKHLHDLREQNQKGGYITSWPEDLKDLKNQVDKKRKSVGEVLQAKVSVKKQKAKAPEITGEKQNLRSPAEKKVVETKIVQRQRTKIPIRKRPVLAKTGLKLASTPRSLTKLVKTGRVQRQKTNIPVRKSSAVPRTGNKPATTPCPETKISKKTVEESINASATRVNRKLKEPNPKTGSNGRQINVLFEGAAETTRPAILPARAPLYTEHLTVDQRELLSSCLQEFRAGKRSIGSETEEVIIFSSAAEMKAAAAGSKSDKCVSTENTDSIEALNFKVEQIMTHLLPEINRKLDSLCAIHLQDISHSTPVRPEYTHKKFQHKSKILLPQGQCAREHAEDELVILEPFPPAAGGNAQESFLDTNSQRKTVCTEQKKKPSSASSTLSFTDLPVQLSSATSKQTTCTDLTLQPSSTSSTCAEITIQSSSASSRQSDSQPSGNQPLQEHFQEHIPVCQAAASFNSNVPSQTFSQHLPLSQAMSSIEPFQQAELSAGSTLQESPLEGPQYDEDYHSAPSEWTLTTATNQISQTLENPEKIPASLPISVEYVAYPCNTLSTSTDSSRGEPNLSSCFGSVHNDASTSFAPSSFGCSRQIGAPSVSSIYPELGDQSKLNLSSSISSSLSESSCSQVLPINVVSQPASQPVARSLTFSSNSINDSLFPDSAFPSMAYSSQPPPRPDEIPIRQPLSTLQVNKMKNYVDIRSRADIQNVDKGSKVRIDRDYARTVKSTAPYPGSFAWSLTQAIFEPSELEGRNFNGNYGKAPLSPRRKSAIEEAVRDMYGPADMHLKTAIKAINSGLRGQRFRSDYRNKSAASWPVGLNVGSVMQMAGIPVQILPAHNNYS